MADLKEKMNKFLFEKKVNEGPIGNSGLTNKAKKNFSMIKDANKFFDTWRDKVETFDSKYNRLVKNGILVKNKKMIDIFDSLNDFFDHLLSDLDNV